MTTVMTVAAHRTEDEIRQRISAIHEYARAGWLPSIEAANYAINELHWVLGEELLAAPYDEENWPGPTSINSSTEGSTK